MRKYYSFLLFLLLVSCKNDNSNSVYDPDLTYSTYTPNASDRIISRAEYADKLYGFWLGQCIANWTGLVTEMDKIGNIGETKTGSFYTREDWGKPDQPNIWNPGVASHLSPTIDFVFMDVDSVWGADDDTDIEYMYQYLLKTNKTSMLTPEQIRQGWLKHIRAEEENFLWVSNQKAFDLMREGMLPPETSDSANNEHHEMIDAQLTTEIFGLYAPGRPDLGLAMASLPIRTTAGETIVDVSEFYVSMYSLASLVDEKLSMKDKIFWMANESRKKMKSTSTHGKMYDFVLAKYQSGISWEAARDSIYYRYQINQKDGYDITSKNLPCNGCFAAGINYAASLVSLFYGEGNLEQTIKIGVLAGWDSDNPTATWGGLLGFMIGKDGVEKTFNRKFSNKFNIHRTRKNFPNGGIDTFEDMAKTGILIIDRVVLEAGGGVDLKKNIWYVPTR